jgi:hypothetical protein
VVRADVATVEILVDLVASLAVNLAANLAASLAAKRIAANTVIRAPHVSAKRYAK